MIDTWCVKKNTLRRELRKLVKELMGRVRSLRFFQSVRDLQQMDRDADVPCLAGITRLFHTIMYHSMYHLTIHTRSRRVYEAASTLSRGGGVC